MKKKGFTLVELLAVIAILAILVIVAMPNVLGMFSSAKVNTFVTEVQKYMDTAKTAFVQTALSKPASPIVFASDGNGDATLDMDGSKSYYIEMNRHGQFTKISIWDNNLCYDGNQTKLNVATSFDKTAVKASDVHDSDPGQDGNAGCNGPIAAQ
jgi:prepilin-type N-terminal cleavage/methylation domain-containing protein